MKKALYIIAALLLLCIDLYAEQCRFNPPGAQVPTCPCIPLVFDSATEAKAAAFSTCGDPLSECAYLQNSYCSTITDDMGNTIYASASCSCPQTGESDPEYCWQTYSHPYTGGCCPIGKCYYAMPPQYDCECDPDESMNGKQCPSRLT